MAKQSPGFSGADLANLVNEAAILAARRNKKIIGTSEFGEALERVVAGPERKSRIISDEEKTIIAYHEGGHALVQRILPKCDPVAKVSVISRGMALGYTMGLPTEDRYLQSKSEFEDKIAGMLGGNVAERLIFGDTTTGASNDIEKATNARPPHGHRVRHEREARPAGLRQARGDRSSSAATSVSSATTRMTWRA